MMKKYIRTSDVFEYKNEIKRMQYFNFCREKALKCGLMCRCHIDGINTILFIEGRKINVIKYYLLTVFKTEDGIDGIKRIISIIFT